MTTKSKKYPRTENINLIKANMKTSPTKEVVASVTVKTSALVFTIVALLPNVISLPLTVKSPFTVRMTRV